jgi:serine/threonine protein kinase
MTRADHDHPESQPPQGPNQPVDAAQPTFDGESVKSFAGGEEGKETDIPEESPDPHAETVNVAHIAAENNDNLTSTKKFPDTSHDQPASEIGEKLVGTVFGDYELLEVIARGGMGIVFKARQRRLNRTVALKMILAGTLADDEDVRRFHAEAESAARLDHTGIVPIHEVGEHAGRHYFSMGFVDGKSLAESVRDGPLPPRRVAEIISEVASAVHCAHEQGIIHRDLKLANVLLDQAGHPKVTDFGLAKMVERESDLTATGQILGTPSYMSPEQAAGQTDTLDHRVDVYSLGAMLYCLLVGRPPFRAASAMETLKQVIEREPVSPRLLNPEVSRDLETICLKCLEKKPSDRFASAQELAEELDRYLQGEPIQSRRVNWAARTYRWCRRKPMTAAFSTSIVLLIVVAGLAAVLASYAAKTGRLSELTKEFEDRLDRPILTAQYLDEVELLIEQIRELSPPDSDEAIAQFRESFTAEIRRQLSRPKLENRPAITSILDELSAREWQDVSELEKEFRTRLRAWESVFLVAAPFTDQQPVFKSGSVSLDAKKILLPSVPGQDNPQTQTILTTYSCQGIVRLTAQFDDTWEAATEIGLVLNAQPSGGYEFLLRVLPNSGFQTVDRADAQLRSFQTIREQGDLFQAEIRRNGIPLLKRSITPEEILSGRLRLSATRERGNLAFIINDQSAIRFRDPFPIGFEQSGQFGLRWPQGTSIMSLEGERQLRAESISALEQADELFDRGLYREALASYVDQTITTEKSEFLQEVRYKQGLCLVKLNREDEADLLFEELMLESGNRWPPLAGCWLWLIRLRQNRLDDADAIYTVLSSRAAEYQFSQLAALIPVELREGILSRYLRPFDSLSTLLNHSPDQMANAVRAGEVDRFLSHDGRGDPLTQMELSRALRFADDLEAALDISRDVALSTGNVTCMRHYSRLLRLTGDPDSALREVTESIEFHKATGRHNVLLIERARVYAALERWDEVERDINEIFKLERDRGLVGIETLTYAYLIKGFLHDRKGKLDQAKLVWDEGFLRCRGVVEKQTTLNAESVNLIILGALSGKLAEKDAKLFIDGLQRSVAGNQFTLLSAAQGIISPESMTPVLKTMWITPRGRQYAEAFAFETVTMRERLSIPLLLAAAELIRQRAFAGDLSETQDEIVWRMVRGALDRVLVQGQLQSAQFIQLVLAWKGTTNIFGWAGVAPNLDVSFRADVAYVLGHRYLTMEQEQQAVEFLNLVADSADPDSPLRTLSSDDLSLIERNHGRLILENHSSAHVSVLIEQGGQEVHRLNVTDRIAIDLPVGTYEVNMAEGQPGLKISQSHAHVTKAGRKSLTIASVPKAGTPVGEDSES